MKVLLAFGTKYGSTEKVADRMAEIMGSYGNDVTVQDLRKRKKVDPSDYDLVVIGSGVIVGSWTKEALKFIDANKQTLTTKKVALFACCGNLLIDPSKEGEYRKLYLEDVAARAGVDRPLSMALFGGEIDFSKYSFMTKAILNGVGAKKAWEEKGVSLEKPYDFRDWDAIERWTSSLVKGE